MSTIQRPVHRPQVFRALESIRIEVMEYSQYKDAAELTNQVRMASEWQGLRIRYSDESMRQGV